jgi:hypothetical protein
MYLKLLAHGKITLELLTNTQKHLVREILIKRVPIFNCGKNVCIWKLYKKIWRAYGRTSAEPKIWEDATFF